jgi:hypothetical protein
LFAASYRITGAWLDIARVDGLYLAGFLLFTACVLRQPRTYPAMAVAGLLAALSFLTKQTALLLCGPSMLYLLWREPQKGLLLLATGVSTAGLISLWFSQASGGWYGYYVFGLLGRQTEWLPKVFRSFWTADWFYHLPAATCLAGFFFWDRLRQRDLEPAAPWLWILLGALAGSFLTRVKLGGYDNVLLPLYAMIAILFGLGLHAGLVSAARLPGRRRGLVEITLYAACLLQLATMVYNPWAQIPSSAERAGWDSLIRRIAATPGEVYLPYHGYLATLAGKQTYAHHSAVWDVQRGQQHDPAAIALRAEFSQATREQYFSLILLDTELHYLGDLRATYDRTDEVLFPEPISAPVTGWKSVPRLIFIPRQR